MLAYLNIENVRIYLFKLEFPDFVFGVSVCRASQQRNDAVFLTKQEQFAVLKGKELENVPYVVES